MNALQRHVLIAAAMRAVIGIAVAVTVYGLTGSGGWALAALLLSGVVINMLFRPRGIVR